MKKVFYACALALVIFFAVIPAGGAFADNENIFDGLTSAQCAVLMETKTGRVLYEKDAHTRLPMASTTKIMTALVALEYACPDDIVTVDKRAVGIEGSSVYLKENEVLTVGELLYALMLRSGNDCAVAIALHISQSVENFAMLMNDMARRMGLKDTNFVNPHGLHDDGHYTSAYDLGVISCAAMQNPVFRQIVSAKRIYIGRGENRRLLINKNKLLNMYSLATGVKIGYTKKAGRCFVGSAEQNGVSLVAVVLKCGPMFEDARALLSKGLDNLHMKLLVPCDKVCAVTWKRGKPTYYYAKGGYYYPFFEGENEKTVKEVVYDEKEKCYKLTVWLGKQLIFSQKLYTI